MHLVQINEGRSVSRGRHSGRPSETNNILQVTPPHTHTFAHTVAHTPSLHRFCINDDTIKTKYNVYCAPCLFPVLVLKPKPQPSEEGFISPDVVLLEAAFAQRLGGGGSWRYLHHSSTSVLTTKQKESVESFVPSFIAEDSTGPIDTAATSWSSKFGSHTKSLRCYKVICHTLYTNAYFIII